MDNFNIHKFFKSEYLHEDKMSSDREIEIIKKDETRPLYVLIHEDETIFREPLVDESIIQEQAEAVSLVAKAQDVATRIRKAISGGRQEGEILDFVFAPLTTAGAKSVLESGELRYRSKLYKK